MISERVSLGTNLRGRVKNTTLARSHALQPLLEAVVNSIQSIDASGAKPQDGLIEVRILREPGLPFEEKQKRNTERIAGFEIADNGVGFNDDNMRSFEMLDSDFKESIGCRGVGRLLWLKAFDRAEIESVFDDAQTNRRMRRRFIFNVEFSPLDVHLADVGLDEPKRTMIRLLGFKPEYRDNAYKTASKVASEILDHCRWTFLRDGGAPAIRVVDGDETASVNDLYEGYLHTKIVADDFYLKGHRFDLTHMKVNVSAAPWHALTWGADGREVFPEKVAPLVKGLPPKLTDDEGEFKYVCYITSSYLNEHVRPERTDFDISADTDLVSGTEPTMAEIRAAAAGKIETFLAPLLKDSRKATRARIDRFVATRAPRYRFIVDAATDDQLFVDPDISDPDLDIHLHKIWFACETDLLAKSREALTKRPDEDVDTFKKRAANYLEQISDFKKSDLANYICHRRVILEALQDAVKLQSDDNYSREEVIHQLLVPMQTTSDEKSFEENNLWVIDERLSFHDYLASDKPIKSMPFVELKSSSRPDVAIYNVMDEPLLVSDHPTRPVGAVTIIELKRPMRKDLKKSGKDPIEQTVDYLELIRQGKAKTKKGREISNAASLPGFCYIICDLAAPMGSYCKKWGLTQTADGLGYFGYQKNYDAFIHVVSFEGLVAAAAQRNHAFFQKLGISVVA